MTRPRSALLAAFMAAGLGFSATSAHAAILLLDLKFDLPTISNANNANTVDAAAGVHGLPAGTTVLQPGITDSWVNIRRHNNAIDGGTVSNNNFDNFFAAAAGNFMVLGDSDANLVGDESGTSSISIPFSIPVHGTSLTISYDLVFDSTVANSDDDFDVDLLGTPVSEVQFVGAPVRNSGTRGNFTQTFTGSALAALGTNQALTFQLVEATGTGSSAVGIDNIRVSFAPEPTSLALVGIALLGVGALSRRGGTRA